MQQIERLIGKRELCQRLNISEATLYRWIRDHEFPAIKVGYRWKFKLSEIEKWPKWGTYGNAASVIKN